MTGAQFALFFLAVLYLTFVHYSAVMNLQRARDAGKLTWLQKPFAYATLGVGLVLDLILNVLASVIVLGTYPRSWLLTGTLIHFKRTGPKGPPALGSGPTWRRVLNVIDRVCAPWHYWVATVVCAQLLDSLDPHPSGCHCRTD